VQELPAGSVGPILEGKGRRLQLEGSPGSRPAVIVPGDRLKRRRIVRTAEVTIETEESILLRDTPDRGSSLVWCPRCRRQVEMVTPERAAQIVGVSPPTIYRWVETGRVHFAQDRGQLVICVPTLPSCEAGPHSSLNLA
jgi:excisionase family DNA binding protein